MAGYFRMLGVEARKRYDAKMTAGAAAAEIRLGRFDNWVGPERLIMDVVRWYQEWDGTLTPDYDANRVRRGDDRIQRDQGGCEEDRRRSFRSSGWSRWPSRVDQFVAARLDTSWRWRTHMIMTTLSARGQSASSCSPWRRPRAQSAPVKSDQDILIQLEHDWDAAFHRHDAAFIDRILADEFIVTYDNGVRADREVELAARNIAQREHRIVHDGRIHREGIRQHRRGLVHAAPGRPVKGRARAERLSIHRRLRVARRTVAVRVEPEHEDQNPRPAKQSSRHQRQSA